MSESKITCIEALQAMLAPPGAGVYTVSHALSERETLLRYLYGDKDPKLTWQESLNQLNVKQAPWIMGIPEDIGGGIQRGANWGPLFLRLGYYQSMPDIKPFELGDVRVIPQLLLDDYITDDIKASCRQHLYGDVNAAYPVSPLSIAYEVASLLYQSYPQAKLLGIGGDHAASFPLIKAKLMAAKNLRQRLAVIHIDAHTDLLDNRMGIPITFGSWVLHVLPLLADPSLWVQFGIRQSAHDKNYWEKQVGVKQYWMDEIKRSGVHAVAEQCIFHLKAQSVDGLYLTVDIDALDASEVSATGTPESGGLSSRLFIEWIQHLSQAFPVVAADIMEFAPRVHHPDLFHQPEPQTTLKHILPIYDTLIQMMAV